MLDLNHGHVPGLERERKFAIEPRKSLHDLGTESRICGDSQQEERKEEKRRRGVHGDLFSLLALLCPALPSPASQFIGSFARWLFIQGSNPLCGP